QVVAEHRAPFGTLDLDTNSTKTFNIYGENHEERFRKHKPTPSKALHNQAVIYFLGCTTAYRHPEIANATSLVLDKLGISTQLLTGQNGEVCCGSPLLRAGFRNTAKLLAEQNVRAILETGIRTVIATCPGCVRALRKDYPQLGVSLPKNIKIFHITEYLMKYKRKLAALMQNSWSTNKTEIIQNLTYHDPCHLGRELGVYDPPRQLLNLIPNTELKEFYHNMDQSDCCGGGGALPKTFPDLAEKITQRRLADTMALSSSHLVSACPNCKRHFTETQTQQGLKSLLILDIMELIAKALKVPAKAE
ncbi:MAG: (Fe-S)-binding protein, partial [Candidatus Thorarchaeota archaeon]